MKKFLLTLFCLFTWINTEAQVTELFTLPGDTTLVVNTLGSNPTELTNYPSPTCGSWSLINKRIFSFEGDGKFWTIQTEDIDYDTYLYLYEKVNDTTFIHLTCNDDDFTLAQSLASKVSWTAQVGKEYHVILGGFFDDAGVTDLHFFPIEFCAINSTRNTFEWINRVELGGDIDNTSGKNNPRYQDFTGQLLTVDTSDIVSVALTPGYRRRVYREYWRIWVDWNFDGDFDDLGEKVFEKNGKNVQTGSFVVPVYVSSSTLRMRVAMRWRRYPPSCGSYANGEIDDYSIKVNGAQTLLEEEEGPGEPEDNFITRLSDSPSSDDIYEFAEIYPNPIVNEDIISGHLRVEKTGVKNIYIFNALGQIVKTSSIDCNEEETRFEISTQGLDKGIYFISLESKQEAAKVIIQ